jgi:hypothetical protein
MVGEELRSIYRILAHSGDDFVKDGREIAQQVNGAAPSWPPDEQNKSPLRWE